ncbi:hypothetical protein RJ639_040302 [Escallonia herrerae]|uniref:Reverse transcriptase Ty1/copia-type domain-containing protein n=1 Tax=Escallonia herrerae TaxID=1293975 RepID=A0AA88WGM4_9ASTE|nr:hypothetical protein RJ639_040302 [Escallonia herrerae]
MVLGESFQVAALIEKLPPTWKDFKNYLKHKRKEMKLEDLIVRLRIEEDNRQSEKKAGNYHQEAKANVVEQENEPRTYSEAMSSPEAPHWKEAVNSEIESIMQNHTWELLNGDLNEEIYIEQPEGFVASNHKRKVCKLVKSLYGLKQAPKQLHEKFDKVMIENGFRINECDKCVYVKGTENGYVIVCLYVDDMLIIGSNNEFIKVTKKMLTSKFEMKDMGVTDVILVSSQFSIHVGIVGIGVLNPSWRSWSSNFDSTFKLVPNHILVKNKLIHVPLLE